jgi:hypothetical protein
LFSIEPLASLFYSFVFEKYNLLAVEELLLKLRRNLAKILPGEKPKNSSPSPIELVFGGIQI